MLANLVQSDASLPDAVCNGGSLAVEWCPLRSPDKSRCRARRRKESVGVPGQESVPRGDSGIERRSRQALRAAHRIQSVFCMMLIIQERTEFWLHRLWSAAALALPEVRTLSVSHITRAKAEADEFGVQVLCAGLSGTFVEP